MMLRRNNFNKINRLDFASRKFVYSKKNYSNPFFGQRRQKISVSGGWSSKVKLFGYASAVIIIIIIWLIFFSNIFKINNISVTGVDESIAKDIETLVRDQAGSGLIGKNNLLIFNKNQLAQTLNNTYYLANISIKKKFFHTLTINLIQKQQVVVWREEEKYYYLDSEGSVIEEVDPLNINRVVYPLIENQTGVKIDERKANIDKNTVNYIVKLFNEFSNKKHGFEIEKFIIDHDANTVKLASLAGPKIYFNLTREAEKQIARLDLIIKENLKDTFKSKEYIDLRYDNNIYIK